MTRRQWLLSAGVVVAAAATVDGTLIEPNTLEITVRRFVQTVPRAHGGGSRLASHSASHPAHLSGLRVAHVSDTHLKRIGTLERHTAAAVTAASPNVIVFSGDIIEHKRDVALAQAFFALFDPMTPKIGVVGNWERWAQVDLAALGRAYASVNGQLLVNASLVLALPDAMLRVIGLDDLRTGHPDMDLAMGGITDRAERQRGITHTLVVQHCPGYRDLGAWAALGSRLTSTLMLSGHTHGGQVAPFGRPVFLPPCSGRYVQGAYADRPSELPALYVSRGIGTSTIPVRLGAAPELVIHDWIVQTG